MLIRKLSGFYFFLLLFNTNLLAQQPRLVLPLGHNVPNEITELKFSPDRKYFATISNDKTIKGWDTKTGKLLYVRENIITAFFTQDDKHILTLSTDGKCQLLNTNSGEILMTTSGSAAKIIYLRLSPDNKTFLTITDGVSNNLVIRDIKTGNTIKSLSTEKSAAGETHAYFSPDGKFIITGRNLGNAVIEIFGVRSGLLLKKLENQHLFVSGEHSPFSTDSRKILTASKDKSVNIVDIETGKAITSFYTGFGPLNDNFMFSPDSKYIIGYKGGLGTSDTSLKIWKSEDNSLVYSAKINTMATFKKPVKVSKDGKQLLIINEQGVGIFDFKTGLLVHTSAHKYQTRLVPVEIAVMSADNKKVITAAIDKRILVTDLNTKNILLQIGDSIIAPPRILRFQIVQFSADEKYLDVITADNVLKNWELNSGKLHRQYSLSGKSASISIAAMKPDGNEVATYSEDGYLNVWDTRIGQIVQRKKIHNENIGVLAYSDNSKYFISSSPYENVAKIWDAATYTLLKILLHPDRVIAAGISPDSKYLVTGCADNQIRIWEINSAKQVQVINGGGSLFSVDFSADQKFIMTTAMFENSRKIWNTQSGALVCTIENSVIFTKNVQFDPVRSNRILIDGKFRFVIWDVNSCQEITSIENYFYESHTYWKFSEDGKYLFNFSSKDSINLSDAITGKFIREVYFPLGRNGIYFNKAGTKIFNYSNAGLQVFDTADFSPKYMLVSTDSAGYIVRLPSGYYQCNPSAAKLLHYVTKDLKIISFEQLDVKYNRPDKVLEALGNTDTALIKSYRKAWEKRIKKLGIDTTAFRDGYSVPEADFTNRDAIEYEQKSGTLKLLIKGNDNTYKLDRFNVWINETPIFGQRGINIRKRNKNDFDTTITIKLSQGENRIETSITNVNGTESYRMPLTVNYSPAVKQKESVRFIGIGIDQFLDTKNNLQYSAKDIRDLSKKLKEKYKDDIIIDTLFNENVTIGNVKALKQKLQQTTVNDKVIIAYSGHGMLSKEYDYFLSTYTVNFEKPEQNGLPYDELENLLDSIPARKKLMLIDACHSGEVDKEDLITLAASSDSLIKGLKPVAYKQEGHLGLKNSFELMQSLFVNVGKSTGATIISAAAGTQFALERNDLKNGVFTYSILEAMNKYPTMKISELKKTVGERVEQITKGLQKPTSRNETIAVDWNLW